MDDRSTVDRYLAALPADQREALQRLRAKVRELVPEATETISYGLPTFKLHGRGLIAYGGWKQHCSIYPMSGTFLDANAEALEPYRAAKGTLHFKPDAPIPEALLEDLIRRRVADVEARHR